MHSPPHPPRSQHVFGILIAKQIWFAIPNLVDNTSIRLETTQPRNRLSTFIAIFLLLFRIRVGREYHRLSLCGEKQSVSI